MQCFLYSADRMNNNELKFRAQISSHSFILNPTRLHNCSCLSILVRRSIEKKRKYLSLLVSVAFSFQMPKCLTQQLLDKITITFRTMEEHFFDLIKIGSVQEEWDKINFINKG